MFHKAFLGGGTNRFVVDIRHLEKVDGEEFVVNPLMWNANIFDKNLVFRDADSGEVFVFDR